MRAQTIHFERGQDPKKTMDIGIQRKIINGLNDLQQERGTGALHLHQNRSTVWLNIHDYSDNFQDVKNKMEKHLSGFYSNIEQRNVLQPGGSWRRNIIVNIKPEYYELFKNAFTLDGFVKESINFERGQEPKDAMGTGIRTIIYDIKEDMLNYGYTINRSLISSILKKEIPSITNNEIDRYIEFEFEKVVTENTVISWFEENKLQKIHDSIVRGIRLTCLDWYKLHSDEAMKQIAKNSGLKI